MTHPCMGPLSHDAEWQALSQPVPVGIAADAIATQRGYTRAMLDALKQTSVSLDLVTVPRNGSPG